MIVCVGQPAQAHNLRRRSAYGLGCAAVGLLLASTVGAEVEAGRDVVRAVTVSCLVTVTVTDHCEQGCQWCESVEWQLAIGKLR